MIRYDARQRSFAVCLSALAGFVDAIGFIATGGFFVSFMSGNSTRLAVGVAQHHAAALLALQLIATFVGGVAIGSMIGRMAGRYRHPLILAWMALLLALAGTAGQLGAVWAAASLMALAMGAENTVFEEDGEVRLGLTYMTGTLVKLGQRLAAAVLGGPRWAWLPHFYLWVGLVGGAITGAATFPLLGFGGLWIASAVLVGLAVFTVFRGEVLFGVATTGDAT